MRTNNTSKPNLTLLHTSLQPHPNTTNTTNKHPYTTTEYSSPPTSPLSSTSTILGSSPTLPSSPTSPSLSPTLFQPLRPGSTSCKLSPNHSHHHKCNQHHSNKTTLRHRPSTIDILLRQERSRASMDSIERQGLDLLEPRPVDLDLDSVPEPGGIEARMFSDISSLDSRNRLSYGSDSDRIDGEDRKRLSQPRFVMGGIFEVLEGRG
ncbi:hypothetical protein BJY04DRAFT_74734 [Aspergillus karnatakaensis]|uniref:uncharacterized protein n=1 Tax=Aspergillus karnatakaensis TaxID=1810916 RepID=UPI003CCE19B4